VLTAIIILYQDADYKVLAGKYLLAMADTEQDNIDVTL
jgi:hypothetical protein